MRPFFKNEGPIRALQRETFLFSPPPHLIMYAHGILISPDNYFFYENARADSLWSEPAANNKPLCSAWEALEVKEKNLMSQSRKKGGFKKTNFSIRQTPETWTNAGICVNQGGLLPRKILDGDSFGLILLFRWAAAHLLTSWSSSEEFLTQFSLCCPLLATLVHCTPFCSWLKCDFKKIQSKFKQQFKIHLFR